MPILQRTDEGYKTAIGKHTSRGIEEYSRGFTLRTWLELVRCAVGVGERDRRGGLS